MYYAPLVLLIVCEILLFWADRRVQLPGWFHIAVTLSLATTLLIVTTMSRKRQGRALNGLRLELTGMQQEVAKAARRYKSLLERAGNAIFVFNSESGALEEVNRLGIELLGFTKEELSSMEGRDLLYPDEREQFRSFVYQMKRHGRVNTTGLKFQRKDGTVFLGEIDGRLIDLGDEQVVLCIVRDVTEKARTEQEIWQRNRELSILNNILTGMNRGPGLDAIPEEILAEILELFGAGGGTIHLVGVNGEPPRLHGCRQVSPQFARQLGDFIAENRARLGAVDIVAEGPDDALRDAARAEGWRAITAVTFKVQGRLVGVMHLMHDARRRYSDPELRFLESAGRQLANVIEHNRLFDELNWKSAELLRSHRLLEKTSHNLSLSEINLKKNLDLVEQANRELNRLDRMKNKFLGMVSHEFNTPLTSIISGADYLLQVQERSENAAVLEMVKNGGLRLRELVADLLKLIRLEARAGEIEPCAIQLKLFLEWMTDQLKPQLDQRRQRLVLGDLDDLPYFHADREYLERIFGELLLNAIKFSPEGSEIEVRGRVVDLETLRERQETLERFNADFLRRCGERCFMEIEVRDTGIGIPTEEQQRIFDIFYEVGEIKHHSSGSGTTQGKGAGLGLAMVKGMVEAHGGMVWVECAKGSSFFLLLPLEQEVSQPALF